MAVVDAGIDVERHAFGGGEVEERGAVTVLGFGGGAWWAAAGLLEHLGVVVLAGLAFGMPRGEVGDRHPGAYAGPELGRAGGHDEGHVAAAGAADEVDAGGVDPRVAAGVGHGVEDVLRGEVGCAGLGAAIGAAEIRGDEHPAHFLGLVDPRRALFEAAAPGVQEDHQRYRGAGGVRRGRVRPPIDHLLEGAVFRARDVHGQFHRGRAGLGGGRALRRDLGFGGEGEGREEERAEPHFSSGRKYALT